jgi:hypothetical protein
LVRKKEEEVDQGVDERPKRVGLIRDLHRTRLPLSM